MSCSQPFVRRSLSQSAKPVAHALVHCPAEHVRDVTWLPEHATALHAPQ